MASFAPFDGCTLGVIIVFEKQDVVPCCRFSQEGFLFFHGCYRVKIIGCDPYEKNIGGAMYHQTCNHRVFL